MITLSVIMIWMITVTTDIFIINIRLYVIAITLQFIIRVH